MQLLDTPPKFRTLTFIYNKPASCCLLSRSEQSVKMPNIRKFGIELLLVVLFVVVSVGFILTYVVAVYNEHVTAFFPYISDTGSEPPESCIFSLVCSIGAIIVLIITYIRHKYLYKIWLDGNVKIYHLNIIATALGLTSVTGLLLVGSFQDNKVASVHFIGAVMVFGFGVFYEWVQLLISYIIYRNTSPQLVGKWTLVIRLVFSIIGSVAFIGTIVIGLISKHNYNKAPYECVHCWTKDDGGYSLHLISTGSEWLMSLTFLLYYLTFHSNFSRISMQVAIVTRYHHTDIIRREGAINEKTPLT